MVLLEQNLEKIWKKHLDILIEQEKLTVFQP
jgi:hypothetical protein